MPRSASRKSDAGRFYSIPVLSAGNVHTYVRMHIRPSHCRVAAGGGFKEVPVLPLKVSQVDPDCPMCAYPIDPGIVARQQPWLVWRFRQTFSDAAVDLPRTHCRRLRVALRGKTSRCRDAPASALDHRPGSSSVSVTRALE